MNKHSHTLPRIASYFFALCLFLFLTAFQAPQPLLPDWLLVLIVLVLIVLFAWWALGSVRRAPAPAVPVKSAPTRSAAPDDLTIIEGIGPKIAGILQASGITTFDQLASQSVERLQDILDRNDLRLADPRSWAEQARLAAAGDNAGLQALQDRLKGGRAA
jgi:Helix-hairpin-helix domain